MAETKRIEQALHFSVGYLVPLGEKLDVHIYGRPVAVPLLAAGASAGTCVITEASGAFTSVQRATRPSSRRKKNVWGGHIGADFSYPICADRQRLVPPRRASCATPQASSEFQVVSNTVATKVGGVQIGGGLRVRF